MINAGYEIIHSLLKKDPEYGIALGHHPSPDCPAPWVTWEYRRDTMSFYWGHYFSDESAAREDMVKRACPRLEL